jgi:hypothetical protein
MLLITKPELAELVSRLGDGSRRSNCRRDRSSSGSSSSGGSGITVDFCLSAVPRDVASFTAAVAGFTGSVKWAAVGCGAVAGDVSYGRLMTLPGF